MMKTAKKRTRMRIRKGKRIIKGKTIRKKIWKRIRMSYQLKNNPKQGFCEKYVMGYI